MDKYDLTGRRSLRPLCLDKNRDAGLRGVHPALDGKSPLIEAAGPKMRNDGEKVGV